MTSSKTRTAPSVKSVYVPGVDFATACSGTKYKNRDDLLMIVLDPGSYVCGCFTVSTMPSAPVIWSKNNNEQNSNLKQRSIFLVNAGNDLLFHALRQSTIGAERLDCRVRDGIGYNTFAIIASKFLYNNIYVCKY